MKVSEKKLTMIEDTLDFSEEEIQQMLDNLDSFSVDEVVEIDRIVDELAVRNQNELAYNDLLEFCKRLHCGQSPPHTSGYVNGY